jgi:hypothetical protein
MARMITSAAAVFLGMTAQGALAQDGTGFSYSGQIGIKYLDAGGAQTLLGADLFATYATGGALGFEAGFITDISLDNGNDLSAFHGAITYDTGFGRVAVGAPRPVTDLLIDTPAFGGSRLVEIEFFSFSPSLVTPFSRIGDAQQFGARFTGEQGALRYGMSVHRVEDLDLTFWQVAGDYRVGNLELDAAIEGIEGEGNLNVTVGGTYAVNNITVGLYLNQNDLVGGIANAKAHLAYAVTDALTVRGHLWHFESGVETSTGLEAEYDFPNKTFVQAGVTRYFSANLLEASFGYKF